MTGWSSSFFGKKKVKPPALKYRIINLKEPEVIRPAGTSYVEVKSESPEPFVAPEILLEAKEFLLTAEDLLKNLPEKWNEAVKTTQKSNEKCILKASESIEKPGQATLKKAFDRAYHACPEFIHEALHGYANSVRVQHFSRFRTGRRKKLKILIEFEKEFLDLKAKFSSTYDFESRLGLVQELNALVLAFAGKIPERLNAGRFHVLIQELLTQTALLLELSGVPEGLALALHMKNQRLLEAFEAALPEYPAHAFIFQYPLSVIEIAKANLLEYQNSGLKFELGLVKLNLDDLQTCLHSLKKDLIKKTKDLKENLPTDALTHRKESIASIHESLEAAFEKLKNHYQLRLNALIPEYEQRVQNQWFWRFRPGRKKLYLLKKTHAKQTALLQLEKDRLLGEPIDTKRKARLEKSLEKLKANPLLNRGKSANILDRISHIAGEILSLSSSMKDLKETHGTTARILAQDLRYSLRKLKLPLSWLNEVCRTLAQAKSRIQKIFPDPPSASPSPIGVSSFTFLHGKPSPVSEEKTPVIA